jgi:hypothetical protein
MTTNNKQTYYLEIGDLGGDGHGRVHFLYFVAQNASEKEVKEIWYKATENIGFDYLLVHQYKSGLDHEKSHKIVMRYVEYEFDDKDEYCVDNFYEEYMFDGIIVLILNKTSELMGKNAKFSVGKRSRNQINFLETIGKINDEKYQNIGYEFFL